MSSHHKISQATLVIYSNIFFIGFYLFGLVDIFFSFITSSSSSVLLFAFFFSPQIDVNNNSFSFAIQRRTIPFVREYFNAHDQRYVYTLCFLEEDLKIYLTYL